MSARLWGALDRLPPWARRSLMIAVPLVLLAVLVAAFVLAPTGAGDHSERASATARLLPPSPTTATEAHARPALPAAKTVRAQQRRRLAGARAVEGGRVRRIVRPCGGRSASSHLRRRRAAPRG